jgi:hypothetical protein
MPPYIIIKGSDVQVFTNQINDRIKTGYSPVGGVSTVVVAGVIIYTQAMLLNQ